MGFFDRFKSLGQTQKYDFSDALIKHYGVKELSVTYGEITKTTSKKFKETLDISEQILEKYARNNHDDIQQELMKKYLKLSQDDLNKQAIEQEELEKNQINSEVDETLEGVDKKTKDQVKKDLEEENKENKQKGKTTDVKDKKKDLQKKIYEATYNRMYKDYSHRVMGMKNAQFDAMGIALGTKEAVEIIAMEKNLEKIDLLYHNHTGKNISDVQRIKEKKEELKSKFEYTQKGIENNTDNRAEKINRLYAVRQEKYEEYIKALKNPAKSPQEKAMYKMDYEKANLDLIQNIPSLNEYSKDLEVQGKSEKMLEEQGLVKDSAINSRIQIPKGKEAKVTDSKTAKIIEDVQKEEEYRDEKSMETTWNAQKDSLEKGQYKVAKEIGDAQRDKRVYDENIDKIPNQSTRIQAKDDVEEKQDRSNADFLSGLRQNVTNMDELSAEELEQRTEDLQQDVEDKVRENAYKEQQEHVRQLRYNKNKRPNG